MRSKTAAKLDEWLEAIASAGKTGDGPAGVTSRELAAKMGRSEQSARAELRRLIESGQARLVGVRMATAIDGKQKPSPVYALT